MPSVPRHSSLRPPGLAAALVLLLALLLPPPAWASRDQETMMEDNTQLLYNGPERRAEALDDMRSLGVGVVKVRVIWRDIAPAGGSRERPDFDAADPASYPASNWDQLDAAVKGIAARGMRPFLMLSSPAPEWATARRSLKGQVGVYRADPADFERFAQAMGRRYAGGFEGLPRVDFWSLWNEPNHPQFIQPLSERAGGRLIPSSPHQYRRLYVAGRGGLDAAGHAGDTVLFGEILPIGQSRLSATNTLRPLHFLREFFCVDENYRPYRGRAARERDCGRFPVISTSGLAYHGYTRPAGPRVRLQHPDDATIGQVRRIETALDRIARTRRVGRSLPIYNTEFGLQTDPPDSCFPTTLAQQAAFINEAEYISFTRPRVKMYSNYELVDDPVFDRSQFPDASCRPFALFQSGLRFGRGAGSAHPEGSPKPSLAAFRTPIYVRAAPRDTLQVFGATRPVGGPGQPVEVLRNGRVVTTAITGERGYILTRVSGSARGRWQLRWSRDGQIFESRVAKALPDIPRRGQ